MPSEKEKFVTKQYVPMGEPIVQNDHTIIYHVKCLFVSRANRTAF